MPNKTRSRVKSSTVGVTRRDQNVSVAGATILSRVFCSLLTTHRGHIFFVSSFGNCNTSDIEELYVRHLETVR
jgi:hypothetical protein